MQPQADGLHDDDVVQLAGDGHLWIAPHCLVGVLVHQQKVAGAANDWDAAAVVGQAHVQCLVEPLWDIVEPHVSHVRARHDAGVGPADAARSVYQLLLHLLDGPAGREF